MRVLQFTHDTRSLSAPVHMMRTQSAAVGLESNPTKLMHVTLPLLDYLSYIPHVARSNRLFFETISGRQDRQLRTTSDGSEACR